MLLVVFLVACDSGVEVRLPTLYGSWNWVESTGGIAGITITPETEHKRLTLIINRNGMLERYINDSLLYSVPFILKKQMIIDKEYDMLEYHVNNWVYSETITKLNSDTLVLEIYGADFFRDTYKKIK